MATEAPLVRGIRPPAKRAGTNKPVSPLAIQSTVPPQSSTVESTSTVQSTVEPTIQSTIQSTVELTIQSTIEPLVQPTIQSTIEPVVQSTIESVVQSTIEPVVQSTIEPVVQSTIEPIVQSVVSEPPAITTTLQPPVLPARNRSATASAGMSPRRVIQGVPPSVYATQFDGDLPAPRKVVRSGNPFQSRTAGEPLGAGMSASTPVAAVSASKSAASAQFHDGSSGGSSISDDAVASRVMSPARISRVQSEYHHAAGGARSPRLGPGKFQPLRAADLASGAAPVLPPKPSVMPRHVAGVRPTGALPQIPQTTSSPSSSTADSSLSTGPSSPPTIATTDASVTMPPGLQSTDPPSDDTPPPLPTAPKPAAGSLRARTRRRKSMMIAALGPPPLPPSAASSSSSSSSSSSTERKPFPQRDPSTMLPKFKVDEPVQQQQTPTASKAATTTTTTTTTTTSEAPAPSSTGLKWLSRMTSGGKKSSQSSKASKQLEKVKSSLVYVSGGKSTARQRSMQDLLGAEHRKFLNLLLAQDMRLVRALFATTEASDIPSVSRCLAHVFETSGKGMALINGAIDALLVGADSASALLTDASFPMATLSAYNRDVGVGYLQSTLRPLIQSASYTNYHTIDLEDQEHVQLVEASTQMFFSKIARSVDSLPLSIRYLVHQLLSRVSRKFPDVAYRVVGQVVFSKFLCPAIVNPESFGLCDQITPSQRHQLLVVSKVLQSLATSEPFADAKMAVFDRFVEAAQAQIVDFFEEIATPPKETSKEILYQVEPELGQFSQLLRHLRVHRAEIGLYFRQTEAQFYLEQFEALFSGLPDDVTQ